MEIRKKLGAVTKEPEVTTTSLTTPIVDLSFLTKVKEL
jgi:hypothetical protein